MKEVLTIDTIKYKSLPFKYKLARFTIKLQESYPFLGEIFTRIEKFKITKTKLASTDGFHFFLNEENLNELTEEEFNFIFLHELFHIILQHRYPKNMMYYEKMYYNIASDLIVNWMIMNMQHELKRNNLSIQSTKEITISSDDLSQDISNVIANTFIEQAKEQGILSDFPPPMIVIKWKNFEDLVPNDNSYDFDLLDIDNKKNLNEVANSDIKELISSAAEAVGNEGVPKCLEKTLEDLQKGRKLPWWIILKRYLDTIKTSDELDFCPPDKRLLYSEIILPGECDSNEVLNNALIVVDVSGSVDKQQLINQLWQVNSILDEFDFDGSIISFGTKVYQEEKLTDKKSLKKFIEHMKVGGGTDWADIVRYIKKNKPAAKPIIVFTDGYFLSFDKGLKNVIFILQQEMKYNFFNSDKNTHMDQLSTLGKIIVIDK